MQALADAGYHAIAPDRRGYGQTGGPDAEDQYTIMHLKPSKSLERDFAGVGTEVVLKAFTCPFWDTRKADIYQNVAAKDKELSTVIYTGELPSWYTEEDLKYCTEQFEKSGFAGAPNWGFKLLAPWVMATYFTKAYYISGEDCAVNDFPGISELAKGPAFKHFVSNLRDVVYIKDAAHFVLEDQPEVFNEKLLTFLAELQK